MSAQNRAARPDITLGSRWELTRRTMNGDRDYIGVVKEIDWDENEAHVYDEAEQVSDQWIPVVLLSVLATQPAQAKATYEELEVLVGELLQNAAGCLGMFEYQRQQGSDLFPDDQWLKPLREAVEKARKLYPKG